MRMISLIQKNIPRIVSSPNGEVFQYLAIPIQVAMGSHGVELRKNMHAAISSVRAEHKLSPLSEHEIEHPVLTKTYWVMKRRLKQVVVGYWDWVYACEIGEHD